MSSPTLISPFKNDPFSFLWTAFQNVFPGRNCEAVYADAPGAVPATVVFDENGTAIVTVYPNYSTDEQVKAFAEALTTAVIETSNWRTVVPRSEVLEALFDEYSCLVDEILHGIKRKYDDEDDEE